MTRDRAEFDAIGLKIEVCANDGDTVIEVYSENPFPPAFHLRVQEALQFLVAKWVFWHAQLRVGKGEVRLELETPLQKASSTRLQPPISPAHAKEYHDHGWTLFGKFLDYVISETKNVHWNPVAYHLYNARESSANSLDSQTIGYCVAVEALASLIDLEQEPRKIEKVANFQRRVLEWFADQDDLQELTARVKSLVGMLSQERVQDRLHTLAGTGHIDRNYITSWTYLRNRHAHPKLKELRKMIQSDFDKLLDRTRKVQVLLYQLTFCLIGYSGPFSDYAEAGFPSKQYPLA